MKSARLRSNLEYQVFRKLVDAYIDIVDIVIPLHNGHGHMIFGYVMSFFSFKGATRFFLM
jgi:hypothetical protein